MSRVRRSAHAAVAAMMAFTAPAAARAQGGFLLQGVYDAELWKTDSASRLLARNEGKPAALGRVNLWSAVEPWRDVVLFGQLRAESGNARPESGSTLVADQYGARWSPSDAFVLEAGKLPHVVGLFPARHLSFRNPLIADPDGYTLRYPAAVKLSGVVSRLDYRAGVLSLPLWHAGYSPPPSPAARPAAGLGITPVTGVRFGGSWSDGPYLNDAAGADWRSFHQRLLAAELQLSRGYAELNAELAHSRYDVPGRAAPADGLAWYADLRATLLPRVYLAARVERNDYPFILPITTPGGTLWIANNSDFTAGEIGAGVRPSSSSLVKLSVRAEHRVPNPNPNAPQASGRAFAFQWSQTFDLVELLTVRR